MSPSNNASSSSTADQSALRYQTGRNLTNRLVWRTSTLEKEDSVFGSYALWLSAEACVGAHDVSLNTLVGSVRAGTLHAPPFAWVALRNGRAEHTSFTPTAELASAFIGMSFVRLEEVDSEGRVVNTVDFGLSQWTDMEVLMSASERGSEGEEEDKTRYLSVARTRYKGRDANCTLTIAASSISGVLAYGGAPVSPNTLETILDISGYQYRSSKNFLRLVIAMVSSQSVDTTGTVMSLAVGGLHSNLYSAVAPSALVDGKERPVAVSSLYSGTFSNSVFKSIIHNVYGTSFAARLQNIDFPAGAQHIVYDPVLGYGSSVIYDGPGSAALRLSPLRPAFLLLWLLLTLLVPTADHHNQRLP